MGKITFVLGAGAGYVLGARAGRDRYEQIMTQFRQLSSNPKVQETAGNLQSQASQLVNKGRGKVSQARQNRGSGADMDESDVLVVDTVDTTYDVVDIPTTRTDTGTDRTGF